MRDVNIKMQIPDPSVKEVVENTFGFGTAAGEVIRHNVGAAVIGFVCGVGGLVHGLVVSPIVSLGRTTGQAIAQRTRKVAKAPAAATPVDAATNGRGDTDGDVGIDPVMVQA